MALNLKDKFNKEAMPTKEELQEKLSNFLADNSEKLKQWFSDSQLDEKLAKVAKKVGATLVYPVLLLYNLFRSPMTSAKDKMLIIAPLAYFIMPVDLIPDVMLGVGFTDDALCLMSSIKTLSSSITPEITQQTKDMCKELIGEADEEAFQKVLDVIEKKGKNN